MFATSRHVTACCAYLNLLSLAFQTLQAERDLFLAQSTPPTPRKTEGIEKTERREEDDVLVVGPPVVKKREVVDVDDFDREEATVSILKKMRKKKVTNSDAARAKAIVDPPPNSDAAKRVAFFSSPSGGSVSPRSKKTTTTTGTMATRTMATGSSNFSSATTTGSSSGTAIPSSSCSSNFSSTTTMGSSSGTVMGFQIAAAKHKQPEYNKTPAAMIAELNSKGVTRETWCWYQISRVTVQEISGGRYERSVVGRKFQARYLNCNLMPGTGRNNSNLSEETFRSELKRFDDAYESGGYRLLGSPSGVKVGFVHNWHYTDADMEVKDSSGASVTCGLSDWVWNEKKQDKWWDVEHVCTVPLGHVLPTGQFCQVTHQRVVQFGKSYMTFIVGNEAEAGVSSNLQPTYDGFDSWANFGGYVPSPRALYALKRDMDKKDAKGYLPKPGGVPMWNIRLMYQQKQRALCNGANGLSLRDIDAKSDTPIMRNCVEDMWRNANPTVNPDTKPAF